MKEEPYLYNLMCQNPLCKKHFKSLKASAMFHSPECREEYFKEKYKK